MFTDYVGLAGMEPGEPDALDVYGLTKRLGEQVGAAVAEHFSMSIVALRLAGPMSAVGWRTFRDPNPAKELIVTDRATSSPCFVAAIEYGSPGFAAFTVTGNHEERVLSWRRTRDALGRSPQARR